LDQEFYNNGTPPEILEAIKQAKEGVITRISETCGGKNLLDVNSTETILRWTLYNSVFYAFTAITTIGNVSSFVSYNADLNLNLN